MHRARAHHRLGSNERMNVFDYAVIAATAFGAVYGVARGVLRMVTTAIALGAALYLAPLYYEEASQFAEQQFGVEPLVGAVIGYSAVFAVAFAGAQIAGLAIVRLVHIAHLGWADRLAGSALGASLVAVVCGLAVMLFTVALPVDAPLLRDSQLAPRLLAYNDLLVRYIPAEAKESFFEKRDVLLDHWLVRAASDIGSRGEDRR
jgi:membrane protein required for colicin V production